MEGIMKSKRKMSEIYKELARQNEVSIKEVKCEINKAIEQAWNAPIGSKQKEEQLRMFPSGKMPTIEEFIQKMTSAIIN
jgi:hypothetical protein